MILCWTLRRIGSVADDSTSQQAFVRGMKHHPPSDQGGRIEPFRLKKSADPVANRNAVRLVRGR